MLADLIGTITIILALVTQSVMLVRWATLQEAKLDAFIKSQMKDNAMVVDRLSVLERNGSPAVKTLGSHLEYEQEELSRILSRVEEHTRAISELAQRLASVEATCGIRHGGG